MFFFKSKTYTDLALITLICYTFSGSVKITPRDFWTPLHTEQLLYSEAPHPTSWSPPIFVVSAPHRGLRFTSPLRCDDEPNPSPRPSEPFTFLNPSRQRRWNQPVPENFGPRMLCNSTVPYLHVISAATMKSTRPREFWIQGALNQQVDLPLVRDSASSTSMVLRHHLISNSKKF